MNGPARLHAGPLQRFRRRLRRWFARRRFRTKLTIISTGICLVCLVAAGAITALHQYRNLELLLLQRAQTLAAVIAANSEAAVAFEDAQGARQLLENLVRDPSVERAWLMLGAKPAEATLLASYGTDTLPPVSWVAWVPGQPRQDGERIEIMTTVRQGADTIGFLLLRLRAQELASLPWKLMQLTALVLVAVVALAYLLARWLQQVVTRPVGALLDTTEAVRKTKNYSLRAPVLTEDELGQLAHAVNAMLEEVQSHNAAREASEARLRELNEKLEELVRIRTRDLEASNQSLKEAIETLHRTQRQLVESEKLAALGALVAGVSHEINTPLGICVTVASHLTEQVRSLEIAYREGLRRSQMEQFLGDARQGLDILNGNLRRAADLIRSFKQIAVDQGSEERRVVDARTYLGEILLSVSPQLKRQNIRTELVCADGIELDTYPGVLAQIVTNLAINAAVHAFEGHPAPQIRIEGRQEGEDFVLVFADNGCGMPAEVRRHVFEPFFTTRRGGGGSGLGLHIVFNQVTQRLGGTIECDSHPGEGTRFVLRLPRRSPG